MLISAGMIAIPALFHSCEKTQIKKADLLHCEKGLHIFAPPLYGSFGSEFVSLAAVLILLLILVLILLLILILVLLLILIFLLILISLFHEDFLHSDLLCGFPQSYYTPPIRIYPLDEKSAPSKMQKRLPL